MIELIETALAAGATLWLVYRTTRAWPADWAKPDHVIHYRALLLSGSGFMAAITFEAFRNSLNTETSSGSVVNILLCLFVAAICAKWPKPRAMRKEAP